MFVSHSMEDVARISDRVLVMNGGNIRYFDIPEKVFADGEHLQEMGLKIPQITQIMNTLSDKGYPVRKGILTVDEAVKALSAILKK